MKNIILYISALSISLFIYSIFVQLGVRALDQDEFVIPFSVLVLTSAVFVSVRTLYFILFRIAEFRTHIWYPLLLILAHTLIALVCMFWAQEVYGLFILESPLILVATLATCVLHQLVFLSQPVIQKSNMYLFCGCCLSLVISLVLYVLLFDTVLQI